MNILISTLKEELSTVKRLESKYLDGLSRLPDENFIVRQVRGGKYVYANKRVRHKVVQRYVGKATDELVERCKEQMAKKKEYKKKLKSVREQKKMIERALRGKTK
jgi:DNA-binding transcriptional regulator YhcF (GntR family)